VIERFETRRQQAVFVAVAVVFAAVILVSIASVADRVGKPSPGFAVWSNLVVPALSPESRAASAKVPFRSVLETADGRTIRSSDELRAEIEAAPLGTAHEYRFRRAGGVLRATLPSARLEWRDVLPVFLPYLLVGSAFFCMALVVFYFKPGHPAARAALAAGGALGATLVLAIDTVSAGWLERPYFLLESLVPGAFLHFSLCFPERKEILKRAPALEWLVYAPFLPLGVLENAVLRTSPAWHLALNDWVYAAMAVTGLVMLGSLVHTYATSRSPLARQRAKVVTAGLALAAFVPSLGLLSVVLLNVPLPINLLSPLFVFFPLSVAYAIARHDLFEVDRYVRTGVVYAALSLLVFLGYAGMVLAAERVVGVDERLPTSLVPIFLLVALLVFQPARTWIQHLVDRLFSRQSYSYRGAVEQTSRALASMLESDRIAAALLSTVTDVMAIEWGVLFAFGRAPAERRIYASSPALAERAAKVVPADDPSFERIAARGRLLTTYEVAPHVGRDAAHAAGDDLASARALGASLLLPVSFEDKPTGLLLLGEKRSGAFYSDEDVALLQTLVHQCAVALENARAYELLQRTRDELVRAERLAAVGQLSAAVAHGIRNPLAGIRAAAQVAREDLDEADGSLAETLDDILAETDRLEVRVRTVLDLSRPFEASPVRGDLNDLVRRFVSGFRTRVPEGIELVVDLDPRLAEACFDPSHLTEALDVLVTNAVQAMSGRGRLRITTRLDDRGADRTAVIDVSDSGPGMTPAQLERAFDLFYTTKAGGTGIGLPVAKRFVEGQRGTLEVASRPGEGATFTVRLPVRDSLTVRDSA
jgi:signal transduction histidine kinase